MTRDDLTLDISQSIEVKAPASDTFASLIRRMTEESTTLDGKPLRLVLEPWPGGRWFRDLGNNQGHLWGFVQVIKPPTLLEITGPLFMSYPVAGHLQFRLTQAAAGTNLTLRHRVLGMIDDDHRQGAVAGWKHMLEGVKENCEE